MIIGNGGFSKLTQYDGEVETFADLPTASAGNSGQLYVVETKTGTLLLGTRKLAGIYRSDGVSWTRLGENAFIGAIGSKEVDETDLADGKIVQYNSTSGKFEYVSASPVGTSIIWSGELADKPANTLHEDGSAISRTTYSNLFDAIGTTHGEGDGSTTFNLPDSRGKFLRFVDEGAGNDPNSGTRIAAATGGNSGDNVGSIQGDATATNSLKARDYYINKYDTDAETGTTGEHSTTFSSGGSWSSGKARTGSNNVLGRNYALHLQGKYSDRALVAGDSETRPLNLYKYSLIYY